MILRISLLSAVSALCLSAAASAQEYCPQMIGMSVCNPSFPSVSATCEADAFMDICLDDTPVEQESECYDDYSEVYQMAYSGATRDCAAIAAECALFHGTINANGGCDFPPPIVIAGDDGGGGGGGGCFADDEDCSDCSDDGWDDGWDDGCENLME